MKSLIFKHGIFLALSLLALIYLPLIPKLEFLRDATFQGLFQLVIIASILMYGINAYANKNVNFQNTISILVGITITSVGAMLFSIISLSVLAFHTDDYSYYEHFLKRFAPIVIKGLIISILITTTYKKTKNAI